MQKTEINKKPGFQISRESDAQVYETDIRWMKAAIALSGRNAGQTWPNPSVGCILTRDRNGASVVVGRGVTSLGGRPHAEVVALENAGVEARGATAYLTLEPCSHYGRTDPCTTALIQAGVKRVVVGMVDPDPRVSGGGLMALKEAGIEVHLGLCEEECRQCHIGHIWRVTKGRPYVKLKMAVSKDGFIGRVGSGQVSISSDRSWQFAHTMRSQSDGIIVGLGTILTDDPMLTCRIPGMFERSPVRFVVDSCARTPICCKLFESANEVPVYCLVCDSAPDANCGKLSEKGATVLKFPMDDHGQVPLNAVMEKLAEIGMTSVMVEGGSRLAASLVRGELVDEMIFVFGQKEIGLNGIPPLYDIPLKWLEESGKYEIKETGSLGIDRVRRYVRRD